MNKVKEASQEQFDNYCRLRDQANDLENKIFLAKTLNEKLALRREKQRLINEAFEALG